MGVSVWGVCVGGLWVYERCVQWVSLCVYEGCVRWVCLCGVCGGVCGYDGCVQWVCLCGVCGGVCAYMRGACSRCVRVWRVCPWGILRADWGLCG